VASSLRRTAVFLLVTDARDCRPVRVQNDSHCLATRRGVRTSSPLSVTQYRRGLPGRFTGRADTPERSIGDAANAIVPRVRDVDGAVWTDRYTGWLR
jgi:hypothetical protein